MKFYKVKVKSATANIDLPNDKEAPSGLAFEREANLRPERNCHSLRKYEGESSQVSASQ